MTKKEYAPLLVVLGLITLAAFAVSVLTSDSLEFPPPEPVSAPGPAPELAAPAPEPAPAPVGEY